MKGQLATWTVEAFIFSGRPNPQWILLEKQACDWMNLWQEAPPSGKDLQPPSRLGYTGCRLQYNEHSHWLMYNGCVSFYDGDSVINKEDKDRQMEYFLLNTARDEVKEVLRSLGVL